MAREHWLARAFCDEMEAVSSTENAHKQGARAPIRFNPIGIGSRLVASVLAGVAAMLALALPAQAQSGLRLCNETSFVLEAAFARPEGEKNYVVEGWRRLRPGECRLAIPAPLRPGVYFSYARSSSAHRGGQRVWKGEFPLCVDPSGSFSIQNPTSCAAMGLDQRSFKALRVDRSSGSTMRFNEPELYNKAGQSAKNAGLQRLLDDAGIDTDSIDGYLGRRSRAAIANFLSERKLAGNTSDDELIDIFEDIARNRSLEVGMMLCNRTESKVMAAIARRRPDGWESRGWWSLDAGACARTVDESLLGEPHYVYAEMDAPDGTRLLKSSQSTFCISRAKFAVLGRDKCTDRRFREAQFFETASPTDGKLVYEFFERSFDPAKRAP
jgi:uncharacterized membrane protein